MWSFTLLSVLGIALQALQVPVVTAQDGSISGPTSSSSAAGYSCDPSQCQLPNCNCASTSPPGGLSPSDVPQFVVFTADDAVQSYTLDSVNQFLAQRKNPNGCPIKMTYFTSLNYTNYTLVTDWYVAGNEIADHTMTHVGTPPADEINGNIIALNALAGIPLDAIQGFRAPYLNYTAQTLQLLADVDFTYDSSSASSIPVTDPGTDAYWPYTLDNGLANDCLTVEGICKGLPKIPGLWEIPMYAFFDDLGVDGPHLMDPWLDTANGASAVNDTATFEYMKNTFTAHYTGNRQPIGLYTHPIHLSTTYPGMQQDVWIVSNEQLLAWVRNPVAVSDLDSFEPLKCPTPQVDPSLNICNGIPQNEAGLLEECDFPDFPFFTCYGCPQVEQVPAGQQMRYRLPSNCSTPFWDPIAGSCLCQSSECAFTDNSRPIGVRYSLNAPTPTYVNFNGASPVKLWSGSLVGMMSALAVGAFGAATGWVLVNV
ncbi:hypothetical protein BDR07DRAFT_1436014 [Suillus spraguei]|nr:hypothetical protein BDR07DRAFT_1436014 [Suillus spraguei]